MGRRRAVSLRATMSDVGRLAGVSHQTVSRVLNEPHRVNEETKKRVFEAMKSLRYHRSTVARALATNRSNNLGLISTGFALHSHSKRMIAFNEAARASGYQVSMVSLVSAEKNAMQSEIDLLLGQGVEGIVFILADKAALGIIDSLEIDVPFVVADSGGSDSVHSVAIDVFLGARIATAHLADLGHQTIAQVAGPDWSLDASERVRGWAAELESRGLALPEIIYGDWSAESGYQAGIKLAADLSATAVLCANDRMALGVLHAFADSGVLVPDRVSVVGFDDIPESAHFIPPLTTIRQDIVRLGLEILARLLSFIEGGATAAPVHTESELIIRKSTGPPPRL